MNSNQQHQIEAYLAGEMNAEEMSAFESLLEVNPELRQELQFQADVINGIGEVRKAQLLARLDAINVSAGWWSVVQNASVLQYVGGAVAILGIGGAAFWFASDQSTTPAELGEGIVVSAPEYEAQVWDFPEIEEIEALSQEAVVKAEEVEEVVREVPDSSEKEVNKAFNPVVPVPSAGDVEADKEFVPQQAPAPEDVDRSTKKTLEVEVLDARGSKIKYRYYGGKLYLYGKFQEEPYQILEINSNAGRRIFLYHMSIFYAIVPTDKPTVLTEVTDQKLIQELSILRNSK